MNPKRGKRINSTPRASHGRLYVFQVPCLIMYVREKQRWRTGLIVQRKDASMGEILQPPWQTTSGLLNTELKFLAI